MDFSALLADLRDVAEKYRGKDAEPSISTVVYVDMFTKILKRVQKTVEDYEDQITVLWVTLNQLASIYKELSAGDPRNQLCRFIFGMCARTVLNIQWPQLDEDSEIKKNFCTTVENVHKILSEQGFPRFQLILDLMESHWTHPILSQIMSAEEDVEGGVEYIEQEDPEILKLRIEIMMKENCEEFALNLCSWSLHNSALTNDLKIKEWQIAMLYKQSEYSKMQEVCESIECHDGIKVMSHLAKMPSNQELCIRLAQIFLIQDWIQSARTCCTQELLKLWIHHQYLADKDEERFLESIWAVAKVSSTTEQIGVLIDGVRKECGEMFIQLYTDLCKFALNIDKGNVEQELEIQNLEEVKKRQMSIAKTCIRLALLVKDYDFHIARVCGLTAFSLNPNIESLNLVNKFYWTIKNTSVTSGRCKINPATLYEIERLLDLMRPSMLKPELNWKQIIPLCKKYKSDREKVLAEAGEVYVPVTSRNSEITVKVENIKLEDPLDTGQSASDKNQIKDECNKFVSKMPSRNTSEQKPFVSSLPIHHKSSMASCTTKVTCTSNAGPQSNIIPPATVQAVSEKPSTAEFEKTLGSQFPSNAFNDLKDGPDLSKKELHKTIQDLQQSINLESQYREQFTSQLTNISTTATKDDTSKSVKAADSMYLGQLKSDSCEQVKSESQSQFHSQNSPCTNIPKPTYGGDSAYNPPAAHAYQRQLSTPQPDNLCGSPPTAHSNHSSNVYPGCARSQQVKGSTARPFSPPFTEPSKNYTSTFGSQISSRPKSVSEHVYSKMHNELLQRHHSSPSTSSVTHQQRCTPTSQIHGAKKPNVLHTTMPFRSNTANTTSNSPQECAKIAQQIAEMHERQRAEREAQRKADKSKSLLNSRNIPSSSQITNMLNLHLKNKNTSQSPLIQKSSILSEQTVQELRKPYQVGSTDNTHVNKPKRRYTKKTSYESADVTNASDVRQRNINKGLQPSSRAIQVAPESVTHLVQSQTMEKQKYYLATSSVMDKLTTDRAGNVSLGDTKQLSVKPVFSMVVPKSLTSPRNQQALLETVTNMVQKVGTNVQSSQPNVQSWNNNTTILTTAANSSLAQQHIVASSSTNQQVLSQSLPDHVLDFLKYPNKKETVNKSIPSAVSGVSSNLRTVNVNEYGTSSLGFTQNTSNTQSRLTSTNYVPEPYIQRPLVSNVQSQIYSSNNFSHQATVGSNYSLSNVQPNVTPSDLSEQLFNQISAVFTQENASNNEMIANTTTDFPNIRQSVDAQSGQVQMLSMQQPPMIAANQTALAHSQMMSNQYLAMTRPNVNQEILSTQHVLGTRQPIPNSQQVLMNQQQASTAEPGNLALQATGIQPLYHMQDLSSQQVVNVQNVQLTSSQQVVNVSTPVNMNVVQQPSINTNSLNRMMMKYPSRKPLDQTSACGFHESNMSFTGQTASTKQTSTQEISPSILQQILSDLMKSGSLKHNPSTGQLEITDCSGLTQKNVSPSGKETTIVPKPSDYHESIKNSVLEATRRILQKRRADKLLKSMQHVASMSTGSLPAQTHAIQTTSSVQSNFQASSRSPIVTNVQIPNVSILTSANTKFSSPSRCTSTSQILSQTSTPGKQVRNVPSSLPDLPDLGSKEFAIDSILSLDSQPDARISTEANTHAHTASRRSYSGPSVDYGVASKVPSPTNRSLPPAFMLLNRGHENQEQPQIQSVSRLEALLTRNQPSKSQQQPAETPNSVPGLQSTYYKANQLAREREDREFNFQGKESNKEQSSRKLFLDKQPKQFVEKTDPREAAKGILSVAEDVVVCQEQNKMDDSLDVRIQDGIANKQNINKLQESPVKTCPTCFSTFATLELLLEHNKSQCSCENIDSKNLSDIKCSQYYFCTKCNFANKKDIVSKHVELCSLTVSHMKAELGVVYQCEMCMAKFVEKESVYTHISKLCPKLKSVDVLKDGQHSLKIESVSQSSSRPEPPTVVNHSLDVPNNTSEYATLDIPHKRSLSTPGELKMKYQTESGPELQSMPKVDEVKISDSAKSDTINKKQNRKSSIVPRKDLSPVGIYAKPEKLDNNVILKDIKEKQSALIDVKIRPDEKDDTCSIKKNVNPILKDERNLSNKMNKETSVTTTVSFGSASGSLEIPNVQPIKKIDENQTNNVFTRSNEEFSVHCSETHSLTVGCSNNHDRKDDLMKSTIKPRKLVKRTTSVKCDNTEKTKQKKEIRSKTNLKETVLPNKQHTGEVSTVSKKQYFVEHETLCKKLLDVKSPALDKKRETEIVEVKQIDKDNELYKLYDVHLAKQVRERIEKEKVERIRKITEAERICKEKEADRIRHENEAERLRMEKEAKHNRENEADRIRKENEAEHIRKEKEAARIRKEKENYIQKEKLMRNKKETESVCKEKEAELVGKEKEAMIIHIDNQRERIRKERTKKKVEKQDTPMKIPTQKTSGQDKNTKGKQIHKTFQKEVELTNKVLKEPDTHTIEREVRKGQSNVAQKLNRMSSSSKLKHVVKRHPISVSKKVSPNPSVIRQERPKRFVKQPRRFIPVTSQDRQFHSKIFTRHSPHVTRNQRLRKLRSISLIKKRVFLIDEMEPIKTTSHKLCKICGVKIFSNTLAHHYSYVHHFGFIAKGDYFKCEHCNFSCPSISSIKQHSPRHADLIIQQVNKQNAQKWRNKMSETNIEQTSSTVGPLACSDELPRSTKIRKHLKAVASRSRCADRLKKISMQGTKESDNFTEESISDQSEMKSGETKVGIVTRSRQRKYSQSEQSPRVEEHDSKMKRKETRSASPTSSVSELSIISSAKGLMATRSRSNSLSSHSSVNTLSSIIFQERERRKPGDIKHTDSAKVKSSNLIRRSSRNRSSYASNSSPVSDDTSSEKSYCVRRRSDKLRSRTKTRKCNKYDSDESTTDSESSDCIPRRMLRSTHGRDAKELQCVSDAGDASPYNVKQLDKNTRKRNASASSSISSVTGKTSLKRVVSIRSDDENENCLKRPEKQRKLSSTSCAKDDGTFVEEVKTNQGLLSKLQQSPVARRTRYSAGNVQAKNYAEQNVSDHYSSENDAIDLHQIDDEEKMVQRRRKKILPTNAHGEESEMPLSTISNKTNVTNDSTEHTNITSKQNKKIDKPLSNKQDKDSILKSTISDDSNQVCDGNVPRRYLLRCKSTEKFSKDQETEFESAEKQELIKRNGDFKLDSKIDVEHKMNQSEHNLKSCAKLGDTETEKVLSGKKPSVAIMLHPDDDDEFAALKDLPIATETDTSCETATTVDQLESTVLLGPDEEFSEFCPPSNAKHSDTLEHAETVASQNIDSLNEVAIESTVLFNPADEFSDIQFSLDSRKAVSSEKDTETCQTEENDCFMSEQSIKPLVTAECLNSSVLLSPDDEFSDLCMPYTPAVCENSKFDSGKQTVKENVLTTAKVSKYKSGLSNDEEYTAKPDDSLVKEVSSAISKFSPSGECNSGTVQEQKRVAPKPSGRFDTEYFKFAETRTLKNYKEEDESSDSDSSSIDSNFINFSNCSASEGNKHDKGSRDSVTNEKKMKKNDSDKAQVDNTNNHVTLSKGEQSQGFISEFQSFYNQMKIHDFPKGRNFRGVGAGGSKSVEQTDQKNDSQNGESSVTMETSPVDSKECEPPPFRQFYKLPECIVLLHRLKSRESPVILEDNCNSIQKTNPESIDVIVIDSDSDDVTVTPVQPVESLNVHVATSEHVYVVSVGDTDDINKQFVGNVDSDETGKSTIPGVLVSPFEGDEKACLSNSHHNTEHKSNETVFNNSMNDEKQKASTLNDDSCIDHLNVQQYEQTIKSSGENDKLTDLQFETDVINNIIEGIVVHVAEHTAKPKDTEKNDLPKIGPETVDDSLNEVDLSIVEENKEQEDIKTHCLRDIPNEIIENSEELSNQIELSKGHSIETFEDAHELPLEMQTIQQTDIGDEVSDSKFVISEQNDLHEQIIDTGHSEILDNKNNLNDLQPVLTLSTEWHAHSKASDIQIEDVGVCRDVLHDAVDVVVRNLSVTSDMETSGNLTENDESYVNSESACDQDGCNQDGCNDNTRDMVNKEHDPILLNTAQLHDDVSSVETSEKDMSEVKTINVKHEICKENMIEKQLNGNNIEAIDISSEIDMNSKNVSYNSIYNHEEVQLKENVETGVHEEIEIARSEDVMDSVDFQDRSIQLTDTLSFDGNVDNTSIIVSDVSVRSNTTMTKHFDSAREHSVEVSVKFERPLLGNELQNSDASQQVEPLLEVESYDQYKSINPEIYNDLPGSPHHLQFKDDISQDVPAVELSSAGESIAAELERAPMDSDTDIEEDQTQNGVRANVKVMEDGERELLSESTSHMIEEPSHGTTESILDEVNTVSNSFLVAGRMDIQEEPIYLDKSCHQAVSDICVPVETEEHQAVIVSEVAHTLTVTSSSYTDICVESGPTEDLVAVQQRSDPTKHSDDDCISGDSFSAASPMTEREEMEKHRDTQLEVDVDIPQGCDTALSLNIITSLVEPTLPIVVQSILEDNPLMLEDTSICAGMDGEIIEPSEDGGSSINPNIASDLKTCTILTDANHVHAVVETSSICKIDGNEGNVNNSMAVGRDIVAAVEENKVELSKASDLLLEGESEQCLKSDENEKLLQFGMCDELAVQLPETTPDTHINDSKSDNISELGNTEDNVDPTITEQGLVLIGDHLAVYSSADAQHGEHAIEEISQKTELTGTSDAKDTALISACDGGKLEISQYEELNVITEGKQKQNLSDVIGTCEILDRNIEGTSETQSSSVTKMCEIGRENGDMISESQSNNVGETCEETQGNVEVISQSKSSNVTVMCEIGQGNGEALSESESNNVTETCEMTQRNVEVIAESEPSYITETCEMENNVHNVESQYQEINIHHSAAILEKNQIQQLSNVVETAVISDGKQNVIDVIVTCEILDKNLEESQPCISTDTCEMLQRNVEVTPDTQSSNVTVMCEIGQGNSEVLSESQSSNVTETCEMTQRNVELIAKSEPSNITETCEMDNKVDNVDLQYQENNIHSAEILEENQIDVLPDSHKCYPTEDLNTVPAIDKSVSFDKIGEIESKVDNNLAPTDLDGSLMHQSSFAIEKHIFLDRNLDMKSESENENVSEVLDTRSASYESATEIQPAELIDRNVDLESKKNIQSKVLETGVSVDNGVNIAWSDELISQEVQPIFDASPKSEVRDSDVELFNCQNEGCESLETEFALDENVSSKTDDKESTEVDCFQDAEYIAIPLYKVEDIKNVTIVNKNTINEATASLNTNIYVACDPNIKNEDVSVSEQYTEMKSDDCVESMTSTIQTLGEMSTHSFETLSTGNETEANDKPFELRDLPFSSSIGMESSTITLEGSPMPMQFQEDAVVSVVTEYECIGNRHCNVQHTTEHSGIVSDGSLEYIDTIVDLHKLSEMPLDVSESKSRNTDDILGMEDCKYESTALVYKADTAMMADTGENQATFALHQTDKYDEQVPDTNSNSSEEILLISNSPILVNDAMASTSVEFMNKETTISVTSCDGKSSLKSSTFVWETDDLQISKMESLVKESPSNANISVAQKLVNASSVPSTNVIEPSVVLPMLESGIKLPCDPIKTKNTDFSVGNTGLNSNDKAVKRFDHSDRSPTKLVWDSLGDVAAKKKTVTRKAAAVVVKSSAHGVFPRARISRSKNYCEEVKKLVSKSKVKSLPPLSASVFHVKTVGTKSVCKASDLSVCNTTPMQTVLPPTVKCSGTDKPIVLDNSNKNMPFKSDNALKVTTGNTSVAYDNEKVATCTVQSSVMEQSMKSISNTPESCLATREQEVKFSTGHEAGLLDKNHSQKEKCLPSGSLDTSVGMHIKKMPHLRKFGPKYKIIHKEIIKSDTEIKSDVTSKSDLEQIGTDEIEFKRRTENMKKALKKSQVQPYQSDFGICDDDTESVLSGISSTNSTDSVESKHQRLQDFVVEAQNPNISRNSSPLFMLAQTNASPDKATISRMTTRLAHTSEYEVPSVAQKIFSGDIVKKYSRRTSAEIIKPVLTQHVWTLQDSNLLPDQVPLSHVQYPDIKAYVTDSINLETEGDTSEECLELVTTSLNYSTHSQDFPVESDHDETAVKLHLLRESRKDEEPFSWDDPQSEAGHRSLPRRRQVHKNESESQRQTRSSSPHKGDTPVKTGQNDCETMHNKRPNRSKLLGHDSSRMQSKRIRLASNNKLDTITPEIDTSRTDGSLSGETGDTSGVMKSRRRNRSMSREKKNELPNPKRNRSASSEKLDLSKVKLAKTSEDETSALNRSDDTIGFCCSMEDLANACEKCLNEAQLSKTAKSEKIESRVRRVIHGGKVFEIEKGYIKETAIKRIPTETTPISGLSVTSKAKTPPPLTESRVRTRLSCVVMDQVDQEHKQAMQHPKSVSYSIKSSNRLSREVTCHRQPHGISAGIQATGNLNEYICATLNEIRKQRNSDSELKKESKWKMPRKQTITRSRFPYSFKKSRK